MELTEIEDFLALARTGSFRRAAELRFITQPAFSRRIMAIEERMGTPLFDRSVTPVDLTPAGQRFLVHAEQISRGIAKAVEDTRAASSALTNPVRIVISHTLAVSFFPFWWKQCTRAMPHLSVRLTGQRIEQCVSDLREGLADFAMVHAAPSFLPFADGTGLQSKTLGTDTILPVMAKRMMGQSVGLLGYAPGSFLGRCVEALTLDLPRHRKIETVFESPSSEVLRAMAMAGFGMAFLPKSLIEDDLEGGFLVSALPKRYQMDLDIHIIRRNGTMTPDCEALWKHLKD
ncbi:MAG: LysR family transcriptional regulator [Proteobacteria bacterium]|nr:LysR family transcriptional regulator [Pseudomonadota bacterium]